jgi:hypothetical protein
MLRRVRGGDVEVFARRVGISEAVYRDLVMFYDNLYL